MISDIRWAFKNCYKEIRHQITSVRSGSTHFGLLDFLFCLQKDMPLGRVVVGKVSLHVWGVAINPGDDLLTAVAGRSLKLPDVSIQIGIRRPAFGQGEVIPQRLKLLFNFTGSFLFFQPPMGVLTNLTLNFVYKIVKKTKKYFAQLRSY